MDDERLKEMRNLGDDYFEELLERIQDIRASENVFIKKLPIFTQLLWIMNQMPNIIRRFFATVQNKLHFAIHGHMAPELIQKRADASKENMGLTSWKGDQIRKSDVTVAKNYLTEQELKELNRIVTMYLDYAEMQAERRQVMYMEDWVERLDAFLEFNEQEILENPGKVSREVAEKLAIKEYEKYHQQRLAEPEKNDFDKFIEENQLK